MMKRTILRTKKKKKKRRTTATLLLYSFGTCPLHVQMRCSTNTLRSLVPFGMRELSLIRKLNVPVVQDLSVSGVWRIQ